MNLFMEMLVLQEFREQMLPVFMDMYSKVEWFQSSIY